ncbi:FIG140336: TPR domain protein [plant metagenome]|uniref:FIG140336: TPR domain protein n=1 Tax=plant metagenome TaxID=1297885 RepID=A0A484T731_9ZZZZ
MSDCAINQAGRVKSQTPLKSIVLALALACAGLPVQAAPKAGDGAQIVAQRLQEKKRVPETEVIRLRPGQLPEVSLSANILYRILVSEIAAQRGVYATAGNTMLELARDTGDYRLARRALEFSLAGGNLSAALDAARYWSRLAPNDPEASSTELALAAASGQTAGLGKTLRARIDAAADKPAAIAQALAVIGRMSDRRKALAVLDEALSDSARKIPASRMALADLAQAAGDAERAASEAREALALAPRSEEAAQRVLEYGLKDDPVRAIADAREFAQRNPDARRLRLVLATQLSDNGDHEGALSEIESMSRRAPEDFDLMFIRAQILYRAGRLPEARGALEQFVEVQAQRERDTAPGTTDAVAASADAYLLLSRIAEEQGDLDGAVQALGRIEDPSVRYSARLRQASLRAKQGNVDEALALIRSAQPQDEEEALQGTLAEAQLLRESNRVDEAIAYLAQADAKQPDTVEIKYDLAMLQERVGNVEEMERLLRQVIALDPEHAHAYNALGYTLADQGQRLPEALALVTRALELAPNDPFIMDSMGWVQYRLGDDEAAAGYLTRAYAVRDDVEIAVHLGEVLWKLNRRAEALKLFRDASARDADNALLKETVQRLGVQP